MTSTNLWNPLKFGLLLAGVALGLSAATQDDAPTARADKTTSAVVSSDSASEPEWQTDFDKALALAAERNRPALLRFTAKWCPPCQVMDQSVFPNPDVKQALSERVIPVILDIDQDQNADLAWRYRVQGFPTMILIDANGKVLNRAGFMSAEGLLEFLPAS